MLIGRRSHSVTYYDNYLYAIGGTVIYSSRECERFNVTLEKWEAFEPLPQECTCVNVIALDESRCLYALGGEVTGHTILNLIQRLSLRSMKWNILKLKLPSPAQCIASFKLDESQVYFVISKKLYCFTPQASSIKLVKVLRRDVISFGPSYYSKGVLYTTRRGTSDKVSLDIN
eukprot:CAMPEP_0204917722 /NCGR_PEP_ID=MMETSP1397-20131031/15352_1 /ASSEMBLY_ACC=CAM_ASM_000891 /TAXON_ID=49980 /ORGANISM="Climacostomum Climacostomum virens, Strain Stock W-24" /LENGTH=172 /DNA_ID=CAMNT_0052090657 /DNA_START=269 /DNA_END=787 /DNA_ORIENTATION=+